jgi:sugar phosphate isomerase/epimerase
MTGKWTIRRHWPGLLLGAGIVWSVWADADAPDGGCAARVFLCGSDLSAWSGDIGEWVNAGGAQVDPQDETRLAAEPGAGTLVNGPRGQTTHLVSKPEFGDVEAHIEFMVPKGSNSGVYFQGRYEIQVLDSWGVEDPTYTDCGGIYQRWDDRRDPPGYEGHAPQVNAPLPPGQWQTFDVVFRAPRFDAQGNKTANARFVRVLHNGKVVHENVEVTGPTRASLYEDEKPLGPLMLQGDHGPVAYRNIRLVPHKDPAKGLINPFFAMDTGTRDEAHTTLASQAAMLAELGYDGGDHTGGQDLPELFTELDQRGLRLFAVYTGLKVDPGESAWQSDLEEALEVLAGRGTMLWTPIVSDTYGVSSDEGDAEAVTLLRRLSVLAAEKGLCVALYPHTGFWLATVDDAVRVAKKVDRPNVGVTFNLCHWLMTDGEGLDARLEEAAPHLFMATINGADAGGRDWKTLIQPLGQGTFDVKPVLRKLHALGYQGPIGLQGFGIGGDVHENLERSIQAWRDLSTSFAEK